MRYQRIPLLCSLGNHSPYCLREASHLRPPPSCSSSPPGSRLQVRCFPCWYCLPVLHSPCADGPRAHNGPAPSFAWQCRFRARCPGPSRDVIRAHTSHLAATRGTQHSPNHLIRYAVIMRNVTERFPLLDPLEHSCPCRGRDLPARIKDGVRVVRQRQKPRMVKGKGERIIA
jgi:hypothetical protein